MNKSRKISLSIIGCGLACIVFLRIGNENMGTSVINVGKKDYYQDMNGELWESKKNYEEYKDTTYYIAPDGTYWENEYRYLQSQR